MLGALRSTASRAGRSVARQVRQASGGGANPVEAVQKEAVHAQAEANKWKMISFGCIPVCLGLGALTFSNMHTHHRHAPDYPFMLYKVKDFPWGPDPLFGIPK